ncbi:MAG: replication factor C small subunit [Candidatus Diapherotrites archaeon]
MKEKDLEGMPWVEKYRPEKLNEVVGQEEVVKRLESYVKNRNSPNLLFSGPAGVGKTSCAVAMAKELYGKEFERNFLELNASVAPETPVLVRIKGKIKRTNFGELAQKYFKKNNEKYAYPKDLEILSVDKDYNLKFMPVKNVSRHKVEKIARIKYEGGSIRTSLNHSLIVIDSEGRLSSKEVSELRQGDLLISFAEEIEGEKTVLDLEKFKPTLFNPLRSGNIKNPKIKTVLDNMELDEELSWLNGMYLAEGCTSIRNGYTSGVTIFTLGYPHEKETAFKVKDLIKSSFGIESQTKLGASGFDRSRLSSIQVRAFNNQLAQFFRNHFYNGAEVKKATTKRTPDFFFSATIQNRISFFKGYMGDATGKWNEYVRYSSRSKENLIDIAWLARITGIDSSVFKQECRLVWELPTYSYIKTELLPVEPFIKAFEKTRIDFRNYFRHSLYGKKSKRISKKLLKEFIKKNGIPNKELKRLIESPLSSIQIKKIEFEEYNDFVYDVSVPGSEMFWGGTTPILLHNSDDRGIDVVRKTIKDFARTIAFDSDFKIIFLDEADALTADAQQALRRTMEKYTRTCRFILSCNYSSRIIEPIQSRCVVFRFKPLSTKEIEEKLKSIEKIEGLKVDEKAFKAIIYASQGDLRKAINVLQSGASMGKSITEKIIFDVSSTAKPEEIKELIKLALNRKFLEAREKLDALLYEHGMSGEDIILQLYRELIAMDEKELDGKTKIDLIDTVGEYNFRLVEGANERIQLEALIAQFMKYKK